MESIGIIFIDMKRILFIAALCQEHSRQCWGREESRTQSELTKVHSVITKGK